MPRMLTSFAVIMALGVGVPALAADEPPKPEAGAEAAAQQQQAEQAPEQLEDEVGAKEEKAEGTPRVEESAEAGGEVPEEPEAAAQGADQTGTDTEQQAETDAPATGEDTRATETGAGEDGAGMAGEGEAATAAGDSGMTEEEPSGQASTTDTTGSGGPSEQVDWAQYVGSPLMSAEGEELGEISTVIAGPDGETMVIIKRGGFLGLGAKQYAMMPQDLRVEGDQVIASMTQDQVAEMPEYEEPEPTE